jgi:hypothetical protein
VPIEFDRQPSSDMLPNSALMSEKKQRIEIPQDLAAQALFLSDRTCCVCRERRRPIQLHHIDGDPGNSVEENLAVLCLDCHRETQIRGGFDRKLDALQVRLYKDDWINIVKAKRNQENAPVTTANSDLILRYLQIKEASEEHSYRFEADYPLVGSMDSTSDAETNLCISSFVTRCLQRFRAEATATTNEKSKMKKGAFPSSAHDWLLISHNVHLFTRQALSLEFGLASYGAGAAHPNTHTKTLNFRMHPSMELELSDIFKPSSKYLDVLSSYCVADLQRQQAQRGFGAADPREQLGKLRNEWVLSGASPEYRNLERLTLSQHGIVIHFDPYQVGSHAEGKYEVVMPAYELRSIVQEEVAAMLHWAI